MKTYTVFKASHEKSGSNFVGYILHSIVFDKRLASKHICRANPRLASKAKDINNWEFEVVSDNLNREELAKELSKHYSDKDMEKYFGFDSTYQFSRNTTDSISGRINKDDKEDIIKKFGKQQNFIDKAVELFKRGSL